MSSNVDEVMQYVGVEARLIQSCSHVRQCLHRFKPFHSTCTQAVDRVTDHSEVHLTGHCGRPFLPVNIDQVEMLRGTKYTWEEVANAIGVSHKHFGAALLSTMLHCRFMWTFVIIILIK